MKTDYKKYCTGCGLCQSKGFTSFSENEKGFIFPDVVDEDMELFCNQCCPMGENGIKEHSGDSVWGDYIGFWTAHSSDSNIRRHSSSGGIITTICCWMLAHNIVDGVIQIRGKVDNPIDTEIVISRSSDEVKTRSGSRYTRSSPLLYIDKYFEGASKYAFVGKPCDCIALRNYMEINPKVKESILYLFSFFCAGTPSQEANAKLLKRLDIEPNECSSLVYRGDGWPGYTKADSSNGKESIIYRERAPSNITLIYNEGNKKSLIKEIILIICIGFLCTLFELLSFFAQGYKLFEERLSFLFFIPLFSKLILKDDIFKHQYFSLLIAIFGIILLLIPTGLELIKEDFIPNIFNFIRL